MALVAIGAECRFSPVTRRFKRSQAACSSLGSHILSIKLNHLPPDSWRVFRAALMDSVHAGWRLQSMSPQRSFALTANSLASSCGFFPSSVRSPSPAPAPLRIPAGLCYPAFCHRSVPWLQGDLCLLCSRLVSRRCHPISPIPAFLPDDPLLWLL